MMDKGAANLRESALNRQASGRKPSQTEALWHPELFSGEVGANLAINAIAITPRQEDNTHPSESCGRAPGIPGHRRGKRPCRQTLR